MESLTKSSLSTLGWGNLHCILNPELWLVPICCSTFQHVKRETFVKDSSFKDSKLYSWLHKGYKAYNGYNGFNGYNGYHGHNGYNGYNGLKWL